MGSMCPMQNGGGFRGPPIPLVVVPIIYHLMRSNPDLKLSKYVRDLLNKGGPVSVAENAHHIVQYVLSKVPSNVLYWFGTKVLQLKPELAMQTTEFLKSRTQLEPASTPEQSLVGNDLGRLVPSDSLTILSDIERRLEKLEMDYQMLQEKHTGSLELPRHKAEGVVEIPRELALSTPPESPKLEALVSSEPGQRRASLEQAESSQPAISETETQALLQEIGLRLGKVVLEWAGDMMRQSLMSAAPTRFTSDSKFGAAGVDPTSRLASSLTA